MTTFSDKLFAGIDPNDREALLHCLQARTETFERGAVILDAGSPVRQFALISEGNVSILQDDYWGNRNILQVLKPGDVFGEAFAALPDAVLNVTAVADTRAKVLFLSLDRVLHTCSNACGFHSRIIGNLFTILAEKNRSLNEKLTHISQRSTREKVLSFLTAQARHNGSAIFDIPMDRQRMADYLSVDRSALSAELSRLRKEGLIDFHKNTFRIIRNEDRGS